MSPSSSARSSSSTRSWLSLVGTTLHCVLHRDGSVAAHRAWRRSMRAVTCQHCGAEVPDGEYCTQCGAHRSRGPGRLHDFVLQPGEHVTTPSVFSTLLPHLAHSRAHLFRWALLAGVAIVALLAATGLVIVAIWVAAFIVPALYIAYLREVEIFT